MATIGKGLGLEQIYVGSKTITEQGEIIATNWYVNLMFIGGQIKMRPLMSAGAFLDFGCEMTAREWKVFQAAIQNPGLWLHVS